jgi:hypothetical protein
MQRDDPFPYDESIAKVRTEVLETTERIWPDFLKVAGFTPRDADSAEKMARQIHFNTTEKSPFANPAEQNRFDTLYEIAYGTFWHAMDVWPEFRKSLTEDETKFYAGIIVESARRAHLVKDSNFPGYCYGSCWIVEHYDNSTLREFIDEKLLKESVNRGFWEMANEGFINAYRPIIHISLSSPERQKPDLYWFVNKYMEHLDLTRIDEFYKEPIMGGLWMTDSYIKAVERAVPKLEIETAGKLVSPIIQRVFQNVLGHEESDFNNYETEAAKIAKEVLPYKAYINTKAVQHMLACEASRWVMLVGTWPYTRNLKIVAEYLDDSGRENLASRTGRTLEDHLRVNDKPKISKSRR